MNATHTPTPWNDQSNPWSDWIVIGNDCLEVAQIEKDSHLSYENAAFIVKACNAHEDLVTALRDLVQISEIAVGFGVMREDANGPLPTAQRLLAKLDGAA